MSTETVTVERERLKAAFLNAAAADDASPLMIAAAEEWLDSALHDAVPSQPQHKGEGLRERRFPDAARQQIRKAAADMEKARSTSPSEFPGHRGIYLANLEGHLGRYTLGLLDALEEAEAALNTANLSGERLTQEDRDRLRKIRHDSVRPPADPTPQQERAAEEAIDFLGEPTAQRERG